jgi:hypothetical protein
MTWLKLSDDFADDLARLDLSDAAFRTHVEALLWTMRRETGGVLDSVDLRRALESPAALDAVRELVDAGVWTDLGDGTFRLNHHMEYQPEPDLINRRRAQGAERQRRKRRKSAGLTSEPAESRSSASPSQPRPGPSRPDPGHAGRHGVTSGETGDDLDAPFLPTSRTREADG